MAPITRLATRWIRPYARRTAGKENAWLRKIRQITEDNTIPAQAMSLAHVGVSALRVTEKILIKNSPVCGLDKSVNNPRRKNTYQGAEIGCCNVGICGVA